MLSLSLITVGLVTIGARAKPTVNDVGRGLDLFLSTPADKVAFASDLRVTSTVKNVGDEDLKILKLGNVLDTEHPTHAFIVTKDGKEVPFNVTRIAPPSDHISENDWVVIPAGENVTSEHNVSALYDFSGSGLGTFTFEPVSRFQVIGLNDTVDTTSGATSIVIADAHSVSITITDDASKRELKLEKRGPQPECADEGRRSIIADSVTEAQSLAATAFTYIKNCRASDQLFKNYFGTSSEKTIMDRFNSILNVDSYPNQLDMLCDGSDMACLGGIFAHSTGVIYYCDKFFKDQWGVEGIKDFCLDKSEHAYRGGTTLRMLVDTLFTSNGSQNGCNWTRGLPDGQKIDNAENYECFAMEALRRTWCPGESPTGCMGGK